MGRCGPKWPETAKRPYLGLGGPNRDSEGTFLGYHPPGLVVCTHSGGPKVRLAPRNGRRGAFRAHFGALRAKMARNGKTAVSGAGRPESGFRGDFSGVPPPGFGGFHTLLRPQSASSTPYRLPGRGRKEGRKEGLYRAPHRVPSRHVNNNNNLCYVYNNKIIMWP